MKKESFGLFISRLILNVSFIVCIGLISGLILMAYYAPARLVKQTVVINKLTGLNPAPAADNSRLASAETDSKWATYSNKEYAFGFKYPKDWQINDVTEEPFYDTQDQNSLLMLEVYGEGENDDSLWVEVKKGGNTDEAISDYIDNYCAAGGAIAKEEKISLGGTEGRSVYFNDLCASDEESPWVFVAFDKKVLILGTPLGINPDSNNYNEIVSSFKFE